MIDYLTVALFVYGVSCVISGLETFYGWDLDQFFQYRRMKGLRVNEDRPKWQQFIMKPTIYCNVCMSSFWGLIGYFLVFDTFVISDLILSCVISAGVITVINKIR